MGSNQLASQKSPYLLQHRDNPVWWQPWGPEAFDLARKQNKPVFLSIGYSTCYWCHVMEKDSFEQQDVAELLNSSFVAIKLDREERPDIDQIYMDVVVGMSGHGGWPMSVFLTPDMVPFWGGTFFYREQFKKILSAISHSWACDRARIDSAATEIQEYLKLQQLRSADEIVEPEHIFERVCTHFSEQFDAQHGGFGKAPKFPPHQALSFLLREFYRTKNTAIEKMIAGTLRGMAFGGFYDQIGGGFARYSTDAAWLVPHFEKMLYDNAQLAYCYSEAFQLLAQSGYAAVAQESLDYLLREMRSEQGGFYSAQDAGEVGREGEFYVWKMAELRNCLNQQELEIAQNIFDISASGNFEHGTNVLALKSSRDWKDKLDPQYRQICDKLFIERSKRTAPHRDEKILCSWNGLTIRAFAKAYQVFGRIEYLKSAQDTARFIQKHLFVNNQLLRRYFQGNAGIVACLEDYAYLVSGLIELYQADFNPSWLELAEQLQNIQDDLFWDTENNQYFCTAADDVLVRQKDLHDNATPSANSVSIQNLQHLYYLGAHLKWHSRAEKMLAGLASEFHRYPQAMCTALVALQLKKVGCKQVIMVDRDSVESGGNGQDLPRQSYRFIQKLNQTFLPFIVRAYAAPHLKDQAMVSPKIGQAKQLLNGKFTVYICENNTCHEPTNEMEKALQLVIAES